MNRIPLFTLAPTSLKAMIALSGSTRHGTLGVRLIELVHLRVSQVNGCGACVDMHWRDLMKQGVDPRHVNAVAGWREAPFFDVRERAAFAWADAINALPQRDDTDAAHHLGHSAFCGEFLHHLLHLLVLLDQATAMQAVHGQVHSSIRL